MKFREYSTAFQEARKNACRSPGLAIAIKTLGVDVNSYESVYKAEIEAVKEIPFASLRMASELNWYRTKRPYFNVYPLIEKKFYELSEELDLSELTVPFGVIEVRTASFTSLLSEVSGGFLLVVDIEGAYQEWFVAKKRKIRQLIDPSQRRQVAENWPGKADASASKDLPEAVNRAIFLCAGVCMLAKDPSIVVPVVLNRHKKELTPEELEKYKQKAIQRTGRIGFNVGENIERMKSTVHYRNGHFAKFYVTNKHEMYPDNCELDKAPIIKWRSGAVVNKDSTPKVPTGFKDQ